jgi:hypothetical protein
MLRCEHPVESGLSRRSDDQRLKGEKTFVDKYSKQNALAAWDG